MINNDVLRRLRYTFELTDSKMMALFELGGMTVTREQVSNWLKKEDAADFSSLNDRSLATFLNGLIIDKRGAREQQPPKPETRLTNNMVLVKLKIALDMRAEDVLEIFNLVKFEISKHELSAFFRRPGHKQYRECLDQILRNFLQGLQLKYHDKIAGRAFDWGDH
jgi:uncharacterized protein YehS (DUF1456 family)